MPVNIMFVGVGGQGTLLASKVLGSVLIDSGYDVKVSEVHGMSQRGGSVVTYVRYGDRVFSPIIEQGQADIIVAFEQLEGLRWISNLKEGGTLIINEQKIDPMPVITGAEKYPEKVIEKIKEMGVNVLPVDALKIALELEAPKTVNIVLLGVMAKKLGFSQELFMTAIDKIIAQRFRDINKTAFLRGYSIS